MPLVFWKTEDQGCCACLQAYFEQRISHPSVQKKGHWHGSGCRMLVLQTLWHKSRRGGKNAVGGSLSQSGYGSITIAAISFKKRSALLFTTSISHASCFLENRRPRLLCLSSSGLRTKNFAPLGPKKGHWHGLGCRMRVLQTLWHKSLPNPPKFGISVVGGREIGPNRPQACNVVDG